MVLPPEFQPHTGSEPLHATSSGLPSHPYVCVRVLLAVRPYHRNVGLRHMTLFEDGSGFLAGLLQQQWWRAPSALNSSGCPGPFLGPVQRCALVSPHHSCFMTTHQAPGALSLHKCSRVPG